MAIYNYHDIFPKISDKAFIAPSADVIGDVTIEEGAGIWFNSVIRGDVAFIKIGKYSNIQDGSVIHVTRNGFPTIIGEGVTIGHKALIHAATLEDYSFVGMGAIIMDRTVIESGAMVAAGSLVTPGKIVKKGELWAGSPAKFFRNLTEDEAEYIKISAQNYYQHAVEYLQKNHE